MDKLDVLVIGGGISGLASAWWLARSGLSVEVWEANARPGGKISSTQQGGYLTERAASVLLNFRPEITELMDGSGLASLKTARLPSAETRRYLLDRGQLQALPMRIGPMFSSPLWSLRGKLRLLAEPFILSGGDNDESVSAFITRRLGREMLEKAMEPFVAGTLASDADHASAAAVLPRLKALEQRYGSIFAGVLVNRLLRRRTACGTDAFSFVGGMGTMVDNLANTPGVNLQNSHHAEELVHGKTGWSATASTPQGQRTITARHVIVATPAPAAASLIDALDGELAALLRGIGYASVTVLHAGLARDAVRHPLDGTGFLTPRSESSTLTGNLWMSSLFANRAPAGKVLLTSYLGGSRAPHVADWDDQRIVEEAVTLLQPLIGLTAVPEMVRIDRHREALPVYHGAYQARMEAITRRLQSIPGLHLEANYRGGVSVRDRIANGHKVAKRIMEESRCSTARQNTPDNAIRTDHNGTYQAGPLVG
ncbi:MAG: protoporphyrinogen oxidase [Gallionella sp.]